MNNIMAAFPKNKKTVILIGLIVFGILLSLSFGGADTEKTTADAGSLDEYKARMEDELEKLCSSIDGVGKCTVSISFSKGEETSYKNGKLVESKPPKVLGVAVACRGAESVRVRQSLTELFTSLFDIPTNRIAILKLN